MPQTEGTLEFIKKKTLAKLAPKRTVFLKALFATRVHSGLRRAYFHKESVVF